MNIRINNYLNEIFTEEENEKINLFLKKEGSLKHRLNELDLIRIEEMLELYSELNNQTPFKTLLIGEEDTAENQELVTHYQTTFKNNFLSLHKQEIFNILSSSHLKHHINRVDVISGIFQTVKDMHDKPEEKLGKSTSQFQKILEADVIPHVEPNKNKLKTYLKRATYIIGALSLVTMAVLSFPISLPVVITGLAMTIAHYAMIGTGSILALTKFSDWIVKKQTAKKEKRKEELLRPYVNSAFHMNTFFRRRNDSQNKLAAANNQTQSELAARPNKRLYAAA